jgi:hypothetical protein
MEAIQMYEQDNAQLHVRPIGYAVLIFAIVFFLKDAK